MTTVLVAASCTGTDDGSVANPDRPDPTATTVPISESPALDHTESPRDPSSELDPTAVVDQANAAAGLLIEAAGDESAATRILLLSSDLGYTIDQIIAAAASARLQLDGVVFTDEGTVLAPNRPPILQLEEHATASGFRSPPERLRVSDIVNWSDRSVGDDTGSSALIILVTLLFQGYSFEQVVTAVLTDQALDETFYLVDERGGLVRPELRFTELPDPAADGGANAESSVPTATASEQPDGTTPPERDAALAELVERAAGAYSITDDLVDRIADEFDASSVVPSVELVIDLDGFVSGEATYTLTQRIESRDQPTVVIVSVVEFTFGPAPLEARDDGLAFEADVTYGSVVNGNDMGTAALVSNGIVDIDLGQIVVDRIPITGVLEAVRFERAG